MSRGETAAPTLPPPTAARSLSCRSSRTRSRSCSGCATPSKHGALGGQDSRQPPHSDGLQHHPARGGGAHAQRCSLPRPCLHALGAAADADACAGPLVARPGAGWPAARSRTRRTSPMRARRLSGAWSASSWWRRRPRPRASPRWGQQEGPWRVLRFCASSLALIGAAPQPLCGSSAPLAAHGAPPLLPQEGLNRSAMDPKERAKAEMRDWLTSTVDSLNTQVGDAAGHGCSWRQLRGSCLGHACHPGLCSTGTSCRGVQGLSLAALSRSPAD